MPAKRSTEGYKAVVVLRGELRLTAGKAAVQVAHAAVMLTLAAQSKHQAALAAWLREGQKKIALLVPTLSDLEQLERLARSKGIPTVWVEDAGFTEVPPGTRTCLGLGPAPGPVLDAITGSLPLL
ncbi:MAG TPA: peptidyl-tRNA hydrolase Pth2 [Thermoplasmata archaeon]|nr:peptidyl-tRNA hydrolase Pth2 [Thermoplasmata archaeon]